MRKLILISSLAALILCSCNPVVSFDQAQPAGAEQLNQFPSSMQGQYISEANGALLTINSKNIVLTYQNDTKMSKKDMDSGYELTDSFLVQKKTNQKIPISIKGDTIIQHLSGIDTFFHFSVKNVVKKFKGYYFLNTKFDDSTWEVKKLSLEKGELSIGKIPKQADIDKLRAITESASDSTSTRFRPSQKEFREFIKKGGFSSEEKYRKIRLE